MMTPSRHPHPRNRKRWQQIQTHDRFCKLIGPTILSHPRALNPQKGPTKSRISQQGRECTTVVLSKWEAGCDITSYVPRMDD